MMNWISKQRSQRKGNKGGNGVDNDDDFAAADALQQQQQQPAAYGGTAGGGGELQASNIIEVSLAGDQEDGNGEGERGSDYNGSNGSGMSVSHTLPSQEDYDNEGTCYPKRKKKSTKKNDRGSKDDEVDPRRKRTIYSLICMTILLVGIGVLIFFWSLKRRNDGRRKNERDDPKPADNIFVEEAELSRLEKLRGLLSPELSNSEEVLYDQGTPQYDALTWVANEDPLQIDLDNPKDVNYIYERYGISLLYFALGGDEWWNTYNFLSATTVCDWNDGEDDGEESFEGINCDDGRSVTGIHLDMNHLSGKIPVEIAAFLPNLRFLGLGSNSIEGNIPKELGSMKKLEWLNLGSNDLSGKIPVEIASLSSLKAFFVYGNKLDGEIPPEVGSLTNLETLYIEGNNFETTNLDEIICEPRLSLGSPSFQHFYADCGSGSSTGVICSCCTHCCDGSGSDCLEGNIQPDEV